MVRGESAARAEAGAEGKDHLRLGNYGFDWAQPLPEKGKKPSQKVVDVDDLSVQDAWQRAEDAGADVHLEGDELNPHFAYDDEDAHAPPGVVSGRRDSSE